MIPTVTFTATYDCVYWSAPDGELECEPTTWGGWCDPCNPWGTVDDDIPESWDTSQTEEPIGHVLPIWQAAEFIADFPGAVWDWQDDCHPSENYRTGVSTRVTLHVAGPGADAALEIADRLREQRKARRMAARTI
jgi:hypothetical protein